MSQAVGFTHVSGARTSEELAALARLGFPVCSFHPMQTFKPDSTEEVFRDIHISIEGDGSLAENLSEIALRMGAIPSVINAEQKLALHLSGVMVSNFMSALVIEAAKVMGKYQNDPDAYIREKLGPLMRQTLKNILENGFPDALTGPAVRGDKKTIDNHLALMRQNGLDTKVYSVLTKVLEEYVARGK